MEKMDDNREFIEKYVKKSTGFYYFYRILIFILAHLLYRPIFKGRENIPEKGPLIIASNHIHLPDPGFVILSTRRCVRYMAKKELHDSPFGFVFRSANTIPVDRQHGAHNSLVAAEEALARGEVVGIFPEGTRNKKGEGLLNFKIGAVKMARDSGAAIVPIAYSSKGRPFLDRYRVVVGEPYYIDKDANLDAENALLKEKIFKLLEESRTL